MKSTLLGIDDTFKSSGLLLPEEVLSLTTNLNNCLESMEAGACLSDDEKLYAVALSVAKSIELVTADSLNDVADTVWSILCWLRQSMKAMVYLKFQVCEVIRHNTDVAPMDRIFDLTKLEIADLFEEDRLYYQAVRYLSVLDEMLIEKGVLMK